MSTMATQRDRAEVPWGLGGESQSWEAEATPPSSLSPPPPHGGSGPTSSDLPVLNLQRSSLHREVSKSVLKMKDSGMEACTSSGA